MEAEVTDPGSDPVAQEMARLVNERLDSVIATQRLHGDALGTILTRLDGHDARFDAVDRRLGAIEERLDAVVQQLKTNHEGVMALLTELVGRKST